jgi:hypothetical protein
MKSSLGRKLRIYAILLRFEELQKERIEKIIVLQELKPIPIMEMKQEYFEQKDLHPKHQKKNKNKFHK